jgi:LuxR family maltose regulon positive regulatory protein
MVACLHAAVLAAALLERDQPAAAQAMLANRLDVIERTGFPDTILVAYRTLANIAFIQGDERHGLNFLQSLGALAERRRLPRLAFYSLAEQVRVHALRSRNETTSRLLKRLDELETEFQRQEFRLYMPQFQLAVAIAKTYAAMARKDGGEAERQIAIANDFATRLNRRRDLLAITVLTAVMAKKRNAADAIALLAEAESLAEIGGCARLLADTHPAAVQMAAGSVVSAATTRDSGKGIDDSVAPLRSGPLTPKEAQVLNLLDQGMSNKSIARVMEISDETVKWHLKNVFLKLSTGTRKHAVDRARLLGLIGS